MIKIINEKVDKYLDLAREMTKLRRMKVSAEQELK